MQYTELFPNRPQLSLFDGPLSPKASTLVAPPTGADEDAELLDELTLSGSIARCQLLLAPVLRELSDSANGRWLTLVAPPSAMSSGWLRAAALNRELILLLQPRAGQSVIDLACKALGSGCSHTVVTWLEELPAAERLRLVAAAQLGGSHALNIRMGA